MTEYALQFDREHLWHPYAPAGSEAAAVVASAEGAVLTLTSGRQLIDGMSSWWCMIHGYRNQTIIQAVEKQLHRLPHVMFGGLTHEPAVRLGELLLDIAPENLRHIFYADSGSVAVEVAMKMALQYQHGKGETNRRHFGALLGGYHGDTWHPMSVCDPVTGMHTLYQGRLPVQQFLPRPVSRFDGEFLPEDAAALAAFFREHGENLAAVIAEPIMQGAGGMWFYHPDYLRRLRALCDSCGVLLIFDEIATGFGRSGKLFAGHHANVNPDILCLGKALTGGTMSFAAVLASSEAAAAISQSEAKVLMHGPTFMANPLACAAAAASIELINTGAWQAQVQHIERVFKEEFAALAGRPFAADIRILGAAAVCELRAPVDMAKITPMFIDAGIWVRPFGKLAYLMPPFTITDDELRRLCRQFIAVLETYHA